MSQKVSKIVTRNCRWCYKEFTSPCRPSMPEGNFCCTRKCFMAWVKDRRDKTVADRFWDKVAIKSGECWLWTGCTKKGYGRVRINDQIFRAHRVAWELVFGRIPEGMVVCHNCPGGDQPRCCNPMHLFLGTQLNNVADMNAKGRHGAGYRWRTPEEIQQIREKATHHSFGELARMFHCKAETIRAIVRRETWKHIN